jgi:hypothetical protein
MLLDYRGEVGRKRWKRGIGRRLRVLDVVERVYRFGLRQWVERGRGFRVASGEIEGNRVSVELLLCSANLQMYGVVD